jgi:hypothetical protein
VRQRLRNQSKVDDELGVVFKRRREQTVKRPAGVEAAFPRRHRAHAVLSTSRTDRPVRVQLESANLSMRLALGLASPTSASVCRHPPQGITD